MFEHNKLLRILCSIGCFIVDIHVIVLYAVVLLYNTFLLFYKPPYLKQNNYENETRPVIFFIHGSGADDRQFIIARQMLKEYPIETINLVGNHLTTIEEYSEQVATKIQLLKIKSVVLIGVSMGGLIASYYANCINHSSVRIKGIVTIGSPFQGAPALNYIPNLLFRCLFSKRHIQMMTNSNFLSDLQKSIHDNNNNYSYLTFGSLSDIHVPNEWSFPINNNKKDHTHVQLCVPGHIALTIYPPIFERIKQFYKEECCSI